MIMEISDIVWRLASLASLPYQERYVLAGTVDKYIIEAELLEDVIGLKFLLEHPGNRTSVNNDQMAALEDLFFYIEANSGEALAGAPTKAEMEALIRESEVWKTLRTKAATALKAFGLPTDMSVEEVERLAE